MDNSCSDGGFRVYLSEIKRRCVNREKLNREELNEENTYLVRAKPTCLVDPMPAVHNFHVFSA
jgi:flavorubredoxin